MISGNRPGSTSRNINSATVTGLILGMAVLVAGSAGAIQLKFKATLTGDDHRPPVATETRGIFRITFNEAETEARFYLTLEKGVGITQAHLHCNTSGDPIVAFLAGFVPGGFDVRHRFAKFTLTNRNIAALNQVCGITDLSDLRQAMENGHIYINVHSLANPSGEIRGQITYSRKDTDGDGIRDKRDADIDGDGILNTADATPYGASFIVPGPLEGRKIQFHYDPNSKLSCNGIEQTTPPVPTECVFGLSQELTISMSGWNGAEALLKADGTMTGSCGGSFIPPFDANTNVYNMVPVCQGGGNDGGEDSPRQDATGLQLVNEWFTDLPWHQKLSTLHSNLIDIPFVMPAEALPKCKSIDAPAARARCMLQYGIVNVMAMHRTDTVYQSGEAPAGQDCQDNNCVEVKLEVQRFHTHTDNAQGYEADVITNNPFAYENPPTRVPSLGFAVTEATVFAPWLPWYTGHYCAVETDNISDSVCYEDYFTTQLIAPAFPPGDWLKKNPALFVPNGEDAYVKFCGSGINSCSLFLGKVDWVKNATEPQVVDCSEPAPGKSLPECRAEVFDRTARVVSQFNSSILQFPDVGRYPWGESEKENLDSAIATNPFIGYYDLTRRNLDPSDKFAPPPTSLFRASRYVLPKRCTGLNFLGARQGESADIDHLKDCAVNFEIHTSGFHEIWKELYGGDTQNLAVRQIDQVLPGFAANQYGRTMFMYAGVPEQKIPVSFKLLDDGMSIHDKMYGSAMYTQYLPMVNPSDLSLASKSYGDDFWHAFFMSNHMNQTPDHFIRGIRGRTLWHNEYRSNVMYKSREIDNPRRDTGTPFEGVLDHVDFPAGFQTANHKSPFHGNTCDSCHIRNGSGIPLMPNGKMPAIHVARGMNPDFQIPAPNHVRDYTYTNPELPSMKMVLFDLGAASELAEQCDANDHTTPTTSTLDRFYTNKIMNFYGNSFHVNQKNGLPTYNMRYVPITDGSGFEVVDKTVRPYQPQRIDIFEVDTGDSCTDIGTDIAAKPASVDSNTWPASCADVSGGAISRAIADGTIGFLHLLGRRLGNTPLIEMIPDQTIKDAKAAQSDATTGITYPGCYGLAAGTRSGEAGATHYRSCDTRQLGNGSSDCYISRWGWMGDRASLEDQIANAASVEMNTTSKESYDDVHPNATSESQLVRYNQTLCGPADASCKSSEPNSDITEQEIRDMATYQRWIGIPNRSEYQVSSDIVQRGEKIFKDLRCSSCHTIDKIAFVENDNMLPDEERTNLRRLQIPGAQQPDYPFVSYLGTDLLLHDMGYLSQVGKSPENQSIRNTDGTVKDQYKAYVQPIRTPALKGLRLNRFVTDSNHNTTRPLQETPAADVIPGCDFLLHDGRACDAIEAAYLHDGPAVKALGMIEALNTLSPEQLADLRAFLYSL